MAKRERESGCCNWCQLEIEIKQSRIIRDFNGVILLRDLYGRLHSFGREKKEFEQVQGEEQSLEHIIASLAEGTD